MTHAPTLESLRRVEAMLVGATGPSVALDREIAEAIGLNVHYSPFHEAPMYSEQLEYGPTIWHAIKPYTASIDAAKSSVPAGCGISMVEPEPGDGNPYASIYNKALGHIARGSAPTLPLAVNLAIVRAHIALSTTATMKEQK